MGSPWSCDRDALNNLMDVIHGMNLNGQPVLVKQMLDLIVLYMDIARRQGVAAIKIFI